MSTTIEVKLYQFSELSEDAQNRIIEAERERRQCDPDADHWNEERNDSARAFADTFGIKWEDDRGYWGIYCTALQDWQTELTGVRLATYLWNNYGHIFSEAKVYGDRYGRGPKRRSRIMRQATCCPFTGVCFDEDLLRPIRAFLARPNTTDTFEDLCNDAARTLQRSAEEELEYYCSSEGVRDDIESGCGRFSGDEQYTEDGTLWTY
jgi:hypothetical protein